MRSVSKASTAAEEIIRLLDLKPHPEEGGFFAETYRSSHRLQAASLPGGYEGERAASTAIYFLLTPESYSHMHRLRGPELFHFYLGDPVELLMLMEDGSSRVQLLGTDLASGMRPQLLVPAGVWQGSRIARPGGLGFALMGTTMAPGFSFDDYEAGDREALIDRYPDQERRIRALS